MTKMKRKVISLLMAMALVMSTGVAAYAAEVPATDVTNQKSVMQVATPEDETMITPRLAQFAEFSGTISSITTKGTVYVDKNYSSVRVIFSGKRTDGSSASATYNVTFSKSGEESKRFQMTLNGSGGVVTLGSMAKGTWNYTITRSSGSGEYIYIVTLHS